MSNSQKQKNMQKGNIHISYIIFLWQEKGSKGYQVIYLVSLSMRNTKRKEVYLNYVNGVSKGRELKTLIQHVTHFKRKQPTNTNL